MPNISSLDIVQNAPQGSSISFDGSTEYARSASTDFSIADAWTIEGWAHVAALPASPAIAYVMDMSESTGANRIAVYVDGTDNKLKVRVAATAASFNVLMSRVVRAGETYCFSVTKSAGNLKLYVNGSLHDSTVGAVTLATSTTRTLTVGSSYTGASFFNGLVRSIAVWNVERAEASVRRTFAGGFAHLSLVENTTTTYQESGNLRHWWRFARPSGGFGVGGAIINDHIIAGGISLETVANGLSTADYSVGQAHWSGAACRFIRTASEGLDSVSSSALGFSAPYSVGFWVRSVDPTFGTAPQVLVQCGGALENNRMIMRQAGDLANDPIEWLQYDSGGTLRQHFRSNSFLTPNAPTWYHVVLTTTGATPNFAIYRDSVELSLLTVVNTAGTFTDTARRVSLGISPALTDPFDGSIGPVCIWNSVLSNDEIRQIYAGRFGFDPRVNFGAYTSSGNLKQFWKPGQDPSSIGRSYAVSGGVALSPVVTTPQTSVTVIA